MIQGHEPGTRWGLEETRVTTVGLSSRNQIKLVHPSVSRFHCEISYINGLWYVADLNSKKGTYLNGREVTEREVLKPGDVIRMSRNVFKFDLVQEGEDEEEDLRSIREAGRDAGSAQAAGGTGEEAALPVAGEAHAEIGELLRRYAEHVTFVAVAAVVVFGIVFGALAYGNHRVETRRAAQEQKRRHRREALAEASALLEAESAPLEKALSALKDVVESYPGTPAAEEAVELYRQAEARMFEQGMSRIESLVEKEDYREAYKTAARLHQQLAAQHLKRLTAEQREFALRLGRAGLQQRRERVVALLQEGRTEEALKLYHRAAQKMVITSKMSEEAQKFLSKLQNLQDRQDSGEGESPEEKDEQDLSNRMAPPSEVVW
jgi:tetratricopeptide (TPR) repeat protein